MDLGGWTDEQMARMNDECACLLCPVSVYLRALLRAVAVWLNDLGFLCPLPNWYRMS
jgi:hypothetical protein